MVTAVVTTNGPFYTADLLETIDSWVMHKKQECVAKAVAGACEAMRNEWCASSRVESSGVMRWGEGAPPPR